MTLSIQKKNREKSTQVDGDKVYYLIYNNKIYC